MKKISVIAVLVILAASATISMAGPRDRGHSMDPRWGMHDSILSKLDLTDEQMEQIRTLRESYQKEITPLRTEVFAKKAEISLLWMQIELDPVKIKTLDREVHNLFGQLREKSTEYRLAFRNILSPEQLPKFLALRGGRHHGHHHSGDWDGGRYDSERPGPRHRR